MHPSFARTALSAATITLSTTLAQAQAQTAPDDGKPAVLLAPVTVRASADASAGGLKPPYAGGQVARGGRVGILGSQDMMDTPFNTINFTQLLIQNQQAASVGDVLQNDPAVRVARGFGNYQQVYIVRGLPVFSDDMSYNGLYGLLPRQYLAAELIERVEVLRGASAFLNGAAPGGSGLGGAVNVSPKRAPNEPLSEVTFGVESGGQAYVAADLARRFGVDQGLGVRVTAVKRDGKTAVDGEKRELDLFSVGADFHTANLRVSADLGYQDHQLRDTQPSITIGAGLPIPSAPDARRNIAQPWTYSNERDTFGTVRAEYDLAPNVTAWAAFGARHGDESNDLSNPTVIDTLGNTQATRFVGSRTDRISTGELGMRARLQTGSIGHTLTLSGATYRAKTDSPFAFSDFGPDFLGTITTNIHSPTPSAPPPATALIGNTIGDTRTSSVAIADTLAFADGTVLLTLGARNQNIKDGSYDESRVTPITGVVFKLGKMTSLYATYIEGLVKGDTAPATSGSAAVVNAGEVFAPYRTRQTEVGVKVDSGRLGGSLSVFDTSKPIYSVGSDNVFRKTDRQRNRGVELSVFGEPLAGLRLLGGATYLDTDVSGKDAIGAPKTQLTLGAEWDIPAVHGLAVNARAVHTASQYADAGNTQRLPSWSRFDLGARYAMTIAQREVTIRARVDNVADKNYWASAGGYPGAGYLVLSTPRTFVLSGTVAF